MLFLCFQLRSGFISEIDAERVGNISVYLGAGRMRKEDKIDLDAGIVLNKKIGDEVTTGETIAYIHTNDEEKVKGATINLLEAFEFADKKPKVKDTVVSVLK